MHRHMQSHHFLGPGHIYRSLEPITLHAVVGDCVSVCLWDTIRAIGAMTHFVYPETRNAARATPLFGNVSTRGAVRLMEEAGARPRTMVAHIIGGAICAGSRDPGVGARNVAVARTVLERLGVAIHAEDVGGAMGRKVAFDTGTGHVIVVKVHRLRLEDWSSGRSA